MANVTGVTDGALVVEPGDTLVILCGLSDEGREDLGNRLRAAMPGVRVEVSFLRSGGSTLLYRPNRDRPRTDDTPLPCAFDPAYVVGWQCDPRRGAHVHAAGSTFTTRRYVPPVEVPERVDQLPPLGDVEHDQGADQ